MPWESAQVAEANLPGEKLVLQVPDQTAKPQPVGCAIFTTTTACGCTFLNCAKKVAFVSVAWRKRHTFT